MSLIMKTINLMFLLVLLPTVAFAVPQLPDSYYGTVTINDRPAEAGSVITAEVDGLQKGSIVIQVTGAYGGLAAVDGKLHVFDTNNGETILFYIQTPSMANKIQAAETAIYSSGGLNELDLTFNGDEIPVTTGGSGGGTGGSGGSSGSGDSGDSDTESEETTTTVFEIQSNVFDINSELDLGDVVLGMATGDEATFTIKGDDHSVKVKSIGALAVLLTIDETDIIINKEEAKNLDLDNDGTDDLEITLNKISSNEVEIIFVKLQTAQQADIGSAVTGMLTASPAYQFITIVFIVIAGGVVIYAFRKKIIKINYARITNRGP